ncbi:MAG: hypothetical protein MUF63_15155, partial [Rhodobacteraceae bacterium]|nr:hypothetical protein [Paracoccaceae bacterium]
PLVNVSVSRRQVLRRCGSASSVVPSFADMVPRRRRSGFLPKGGEDAPRADPDLSKGARKINSLLAAAPAQGGG